MESPQSLFPDPPPPPTPSGEHPPHAANPSKVPTAPAPIWLQRLSLVILVLFCFYLGGVVTYLPWWTQIWDHNLFFNSHPQLWTILRLRPVRGVISGLGLLDIWIGISEAIHYRDQRV